MQPRRHFGRPALSVSQKRIEKVGVACTADEAELLERYRRKHILSSRADCIRVAALLEVRRDLGLDTT